MQDSDKKITPLKKITLALEAGTKLGEKDIKIESPFEFIFGVGTDGLVPFECELVNLSEGDEMTIHIKQEGISLYFKHLTISPPNTAGSLENYYLNVRVLKVAPADPKEVIGAMANIANCGDHCCGH